jgi:HemY protein
MKRLIILFLVFFVAVAISPFLIGEKGYILLAMGDYTIESTVVTASLFILVLFIVLLLSLKLLRGGIRLSVGSWNKLYFAKTRRAQREFSQGIAAYVLGDYPQAEKLLVKSAERNAMENISYLIAADAAQQQNLSANTEYYIKCLNALDLPENAQNLESILVTIHQYIKLKDYTHARQLIDQHHRHLGHDSRLLSLEIDLCLIEQRFDTAIDYLVKARKQKAITEQRITDWEKCAFTGKFNELMVKTDQQALLSYWAKLPRKLKHTDVIIFAYCQQLAQHHIIEPLNKLLLPGFTFIADEQFLKNVRTLPLNRPQALIDQVQKLLHKDPQSIKWLSCLGFLAFAGRQYDMSAKAYGSAYVQSPESLDKADLTFYAKALIAKGQPEPANQLLMRAMQK